MSEPHSAQHSQTVCCDTDVCVVCVTELGIFNFRRSLVASGSIQLEQTNGRKMKAMEGFGVGLAAK